jgi:hypothetical protein
VALLFDARCAGKETKMATKEAIEGPRSFARFIENVGEGDFHQDASDALFELGKSIQDLALRTESKVKGKLTLTVDLSCDPRGVIGVNVDVVTKKPKAKRAPAQAWITKHGNVVFEHPRQTKLPLREVGGAEVTVTLERAGEGRAVKEI